VIVVDTSAIVAILLAEPEAAAFRVQIAAEVDVRISAMTDYEARLIGFHRQGAPLLADYEMLIGDWVVEAFDRKQSTLAFAAYRRYGRGNHPARLNFADCAAYALAKSLDAALVFKGADFAQTDVRVAA
jgi:ribonuclease VapC